MNNKKALERSPTIDDTLSRYFSVFASYYEQLDDMPPNEQETKKKELLKSIFSNNTFTLEDLDTILLSDITSVSQKYRSYEINSLRRFVSYGIPYYTNLKPSHIKEMLRYEPGLVLKNLSYVTKVTNGIVTLDYLRNLIKEDSSLAYEVLPENYQFLGMSAKEILTNPEIPSFVKMAVLSRNPRVINSLELANLIAIFKNLEKMTLEEKTMPSYLRNIIRVIGFLPYGIQKSIIDFCLQRGWVTPLVEKIDAQQVYTDEELLTKILHLDLSSTYLLKSILGVFYRKPDLASSLNSKLERFILNNFLTRSSLSLHTYTNLLTYSEVLASLSGSFKNHLWTEIHKSLLLSKSDSDKRDLIFMLSRVAFILDGTPPNWVIDLLKNSIGEDPRIFRGFILSCRHWSNTFITQQGSSLMRILEDYYGGDISELEVFITDIVRIFLRYLDFTGLDKLYALFSYGEYASSLFNTVLTKELESWYNTHTPKNLVFFSEVELKRVLNLFALTGIHHKELLEEINYNKIRKDFEEVTNKPETFIDVEKELARYYIALGIYERLHGDLLIHINNPEGFDKSGLHRQPLEPSRLKDRIKLSKIEGFLRHAVLGVYDWLPDYLVTIVLSELQYQDYIGFFDERLLDNPYRVDRFTITESPYSFLNRSKTKFNEGFWLNTDDRIHYGGPLWSRISELALYILQADIRKAPIENAFLIDMLVDLEHNYGNVFSGKGFTRVGVTKGLDQLLEKKKTSQVEELIDYAEETFLLSSKDCDNYRKLLVYVDDLSKGIPTRPRGYD